MKTEDVMRQIHEHETLKESYKGIIDKKISPIANEWAKIFGLFAGKNLIRKGERPTPSWSRYELEKSVSVSWHDHDGFGHFYKTCLPSMVYLGFPSYEEMEGDEFTLTFDEIDSPHSIIEGWWKRLRAWREFVVQERKGVRL